MDSKILIEVVKCNVLFTVSLLSGIFQSFTDLRCSSDHDDSLHYCSAVQCDPQSSLITTCWCLLVSFLKIKISSIEKEFERFS